MNTFWNAQHPANFAMFSPSHLAAAALIAIAAAALYVWREPLGRSRPYKDLVRCGIIAALLLPEIALNIWYGAEGLWNVKSTLPLELCSITLVLSVFMLWTRSRRLYSILFFAGICGALQAIATPSLGYPFPHFRFFHFFIAHGAIIMASLYMTWIENCKPSWKSVGAAMLFLNLLMLGVGGVNRMLGSNYMFLMHKPDTPSMLDMLGPHPYYLIAEEAIALTMFVLLYLLFFRMPALLFPSSKKFHETPGKREYYDGR
ncbi:Integral membrane protein (intg_mem_TP0381) [Paenibacillus konkukensis]|uniref:Integral membrane protein (Intg_mem_TP0381) n=1 Tax=Paenibacillus konkukensis TaxID=2020716 RepID=A0ABY4RWA9_9BACL|nr:TIGR02206 family membrane protein [Paenibacillus konkukensis]UQZ86060.1 Integral membrane protein (intg_mem_TP0381) [Paenibacillus konkukensis]